MGLWSTLKSGAKKFGKFAWDHREGIGKVIGTGLDIASNLGVPGANIASKIVRGAANVSKALGDDKFSKGLQSTSSKSNSDFDSLKAKYKQMKAEMKAKDNTSNPSSQGYSLNTRTNLGTKEGARVNSWKH